MQKRAAHVQAEGRAWVVDVGQAEKVAQHRLGLVQRHRAADDEFASLIEGHGQWYDPQERHSKSDSPSRLDLQLMHWVAVGTASRRPRPIGPLQVRQMPKVPSSMRCRASFK